MIIIIKEEEEKKNMKKYKLSGKTCTHTFWYLQYN